MAVPEPFRCVIYGEVASKANSRRHVKGISKKTGKSFRRSIKSEAALGWLEGAAYQVREQSADKLFDCPVAASLRLWYDDNRRDLDPSLVLDFLQGRVYTNDRRVRELHVYHGIDKQDPRVEVLITEISDIRSHDEFREDVHLSNMLETQSAQKRPKRATSKKVIASVT